MKLKILNEQTLPKQMGGGSKTARINFGKSGVITFNLTACELLELKPGDKVSLSQDEEEPENWYFFKDPDAGFLLRAGYDNKGCLFNHIKMNEELGSYFSLEKGASYNCLIAGKPTIVKGDKTKYWGLIVRK